MGENNLIFKNMEMQLLKKVIIRGKIKTLTGLHIGGSNNTVQIGGVDTAVVRNPIDNKPYIPGSSLKGKMRCLLEQSLGVFGKRINDKVQHPASDFTSGEKAIPVLRLFGTASGDDNNIPSRIIVRDCELIDDDFKIRDNTNTDLPYTEAKTEITIDRITAAAIPRQIERVPAGIEFSLDIVVNIFSDDVEKEMMELVYNGMRLLQDDYLGGKGSRGSGQVKFIVEKVIERSSNFYLENMHEAEKEYTSVVLPAELK